MFLAVLLQWMSIVSDGKPPIHEHVSDDDEEYFLSTPYHSSTTLTLARSRHFS